MFLLTIITAILTALLCWFYYTIKQAALEGELIEARHLLERQKNRVCYPMDEQLKIQVQVAEFIGRHR